MPEEKNRRCQCAWAVRHQLLTLEGLEHLAEVQPGKTVWLAPGPEGGGPIRSPELLVGGIRHLEKICDISLASAEELIDRQAYGELQKLILETLEGCVPE